MLFPSHGSVAGVPEPPGDFKDNYQHLKNLINTALRDGAPLEALHLIPKDAGRKNPKTLTKDDLIRLLHTLRRIRTRYQRLLQAPVPKELIRDVLAKPPEDRLPWETEALEKQEQWQDKVRAVRARVQQELNDHLNDDFFHDL